MKKLLALILLIAGVLVGWFAVSPWLAMKGLADAAMEGDAEELAERIDFEALRADANSQFGAVARDIAEDDTIVDVIGGEMVEQIGRVLTERALTPEVMGNVVRYGAFAAPLLPEALRGQPLNWDVQRDGIDSFRGVGTYDDGTFGPVLYFERKGIGWRLTGFEFCDLEPPCARYGYIE